MQGTPAAAPTSVSSAPAPLTIPAIFDPLVSVLLDRPSTSSPRSQLEPELYALVPRPYELGKFGLYVSRAEQAKVVDTNFKDKDGETCIKLTVRPHSPSTFFCREF